MAKKTAPKTRREIVRQAILSAAKELVCRRGPHATTVRDITEASGANVAAVNYYFQSKDDLLALAMAEIVGEINREREAQLAAARATSTGPLSAETLLRALIEPILRGARAKDGGSLYLRVLQHIRINPDDSFSNQLFEGNRRVAQAFIAEMTASFPQTGRIELAWRYEFARGAAAHLLGNLDPKSRRTEALAREDRLADVASMVLDQSAIDRTITLILTGFAGPET
jgi:AcrR family transcriptional regulator